MSLDLADLDGIDGAEILRRWKAEGLAPGFAGLIGFEVDSFSPGEARLVCPVSDRHANLMAGVHGGVMAGLCDAATGCALLSLLEPDERFATTDLQIRYLKAAPVSVDRLVVDARIVHKGRRMAVAECVVASGEDRVHARASASMMITQPRR